MDTSTAKENSSNITQVKIGVLLTVLVSGAFVSVLNETLLNVALNHIMGDFKVAYGTIQWLVTGYMLIIGTLVPISAYFTQRFTTRQIFIAAMSLFTIGTIIGGFSPTFSVLLIGRLVQAFGTALIIPLLTNILLVVIPVEKRGAIMGGVMSLVFMFAPAIGPTLSGLIIENLSWRWTFYLVLPIALFSLLAGIKILKNINEVSKPRLDVISYILSVLGFGGIVYGFSLAGEGGGEFTDICVVAWLIIGVLALGLFSWRQFSMKTPILNLRVFAYPMFTFSLIFVVLVMMTMFSLMLMLPIYMQGSLLFAAVFAGLALLPGGLLNALLAPLTGKLFDKFGPRPLLIPGSIILATVVYSYRFTLPGVSIWIIVIQHAVLMISIAMMLMPAQTNALNQLPPELYPHGSAIANTLMQVSGAIGAALFIAISESKQNKFLANIKKPTNQDLTDALTAGSQQAFTTGFYFACVTILLSLIIKKSYKGKLNS